jgi:TetR/AcrR family transcriptional regulator of autoinduction and epiphytic fitness
MRFHQMSRPVKGPRAYDASRRRQQARETRRRVLDAAHDLFVERGYAGTAMVDVAQRAGVAVQTVYSLVGGKPDLIKTVIDVGVAGDDEPVPVRDRPVVQRLMAEPDGRTKLAMHARFVADVMERLDGLWVPLRVAADSDPALARLVASMDAGRLEAMGEFSSHLKAAGLLRRGVSVRRAAQVIAAHMDPRFHQLLVREMGWSRRDYERWFVTTVAAQVLDPE